MDSTNPEAATNDAEQQHQPVASAKHTTERKMVDITRDKPIKVAVKIMVPVRDHPKFNFVGKLLGPKGNTLKRLQEETMCKMAVLGKGSMRDRNKEEECRVSGDLKFEHLNEELHVDVCAVAAPAEAHARVAYALTLLARYLVPDYNDDIRNEQMMEMHMLQAANNIEQGGIVTSTEPNSESVMHNVAGLVQSPPDLLNIPNAMLIQQGPPHGFHLPDINHAGWLRHQQQRRGLRTPHRKSVFSILSKARAVRTKHNMYSSTLASSELAGRINMNII